MAESLDQMLEPGERVIYRAPRTWMPANWSEDIAFFLLCIGIVAATPLVGPGPAGLAALGATILGPAVFFLRRVVDEWSQEVLLTNRRLFHRGGWRKSKLTEIEIAEVAKVENAENRALRITRRDGSKLLLIHPRKSRDIALALARASRVNSPRAAPRHEMLADRIWFFCAVICGIAAAIVQFKMLYPHLTEISDRLLPIFATWSLLITFLAFLFGFLFGGNVLSIVLLRPFFTYEEMATWLNHSVLFWSGGSTREETTAGQPLWAPYLLYGQVPRYEDFDGRGSSHG